MIDLNKLYTCYPLTGEHPYPYCYEVRLLSWDGNKYCIVEYAGKKYSFKIFYLSDIPINEESETSDLLFSRLDKEAFNNFLDSVPVDRSFSDPSVISV